MWSYNRIHKKEQASDCVMYLFGLSDGPDTLDKKSSLYNVKLSDVEQANYVFQRLFKTRVFDYLRVGQQTLMKNALRSIDNVTSYWKWSDLFNALKLHIQGDTGPYSNEEDFDKLLEGRYIISEKLKELSHKSLELETSIKSIKKIKEALDWFSVHMRDNSSELASIIFAVHDQ